MKLKSLLAVAAIAPMFRWQTGAQNSISNNNFVQISTNEAQAVIATNWPDIRVAHGQVYDVTLSPEWKLVTIPTGTPIRGAYFNGSIRPIQVEFHLMNPAAPNNLNAASRVTVEHYPYDPKQFTRKNIQQYSEIVTKYPQTLRLFPLGKQTTNWTALGQMTIIPARPIFDFGLPYTNTTATVSKPLRRCASSRCRRWPR